MLRHNDVFIVDIQEQGIEAKDKDILLESFEGLMCNTSSLVKKPNTMLMNLLGPDSIPKVIASLWNACLKKRD